MPLECISLPRSTTSTLKYFSSSVNIKRLKRYFVFFVKGLGNTAELTPTSPISPFLVPLSVNLRPSGPKNEFTAVFVL